MAPVTPADVIAAANRIAPFVRRTPTIRVDPTEMPELPVAVDLKLELFQHTGSFKARGAFNRVLTESVPSAGLITASGGNHGAALAWVARALGHRSQIFVPETSPSMKADRIRSYGADVVLGGARYDDAQAAANERQLVSGALMVHPYDHAATAAGAGTCAYEMEQQLDGIDTVLVATGGGGLMAGTATWFGRRVRVVSVEPETSQCLATALRAGHRVTVPVEGMAIDSLGAKMVGEVPFACAVANGVVGITVPDSAIVAAQQALWRSLRLIVEPGGAAALAALLCGAYGPGVGERIAVIVCGANCDPTSVT